MIPPAPSLSGDRDGVGEGGGPGNRRAVVYRLDRLVSRSRSCSLLRSTTELGCSDVMGATAPLRWRIIPGEEGGPRIFSGVDFVRSVCLYLGFAGGSILPILFDFGQIEEARLDPPRLGFLPLVADGEVVRSLWIFRFVFEWILFALCWRSAFHSHREVSMALAFCIKDGEVGVGSVDGRWMNQAQASPSDGCQRRRALIHGQEGSGCVPGRWLFSVCFIPSLESSVLLRLFSKPWCDGASSDLG